jgi:phenylpropionate dioxygenase-like ring-hydroxylating dioxygenase large terminal subunit
MDPATQVELIRRLLDYAEHKTTGMVEAEAYNDVNDYLDPQQLRTEQAILFRRYPLAVGFASHVRQPGDFFTHEDAGVPILVVRDGAGRLRAFLNVCRHRGSLLVPEARGCGKKVFVCPYHAWSYDAEGRLLGMPQEFGFAGLERERYGLRALPVAERFGLVWVRPTPEPPGAAPLDVPPLDVPPLDVPLLDMDAYLGPWARDFAGFGLERFVHFRTATLRRRMNWKLMVDTFLEFYHFRWAHSRSIYPLFLDNVTSFDAHGPHVRLVSAKRTLLELRGRPEQEWNLLEHSLCLYGVFPNSVITMQGDHGALFAMFPVADRVDEAVLHVSLLIPEEPQTDAARQHWETNLELLCAAVTEDFAIGERIQRTLTSGANTHTTYGRIEPGLDVYHRHINEAIGKASTRP